MRRRLRISLLILALAGMALAQSPVTKRVQIMAQALDGSTLPSVRFKIAGTDGAVREFETGKFGSIGEAVAGDDASLTVTLADDRYRIRSHTESFKRGGSSDATLHFFRLYKADPKLMTAGERADYLRELPGIQLYERSQLKELPGDPGDPTPLRLSAFLDGSRPAGHADLSSPPDDDQAPDPDAASFHLNIVDDVGRPAAGALISVYKLDGKSGALTTTTTTRADGDGSVLVEGLSAGSYFRVLARSSNDAELAARSPIVRPARKERIEFKPLALRRPGRAISGLVFAGDKPIGDARVSVRGAGQPSLSALTDQLGHFEIAPLNGGNVTLSIRRLGDGAEGTMTVPVDGTEILVPLDVLTLPVAE